jgi:predicted nucleic acid-binding protein
MATSSPRRPRVFVDSDVLFAGAASASTHGASLMILRLAEVTLIEAVASEQVLVEVERNLAAKLPAALTAYRLLAERCLKIVPVPRLEELEPFNGLADRKDQSILAAAVLNQCPWLVTFNVRHFRPGHPDVVVAPPGEFIQRVRHLLSAL